MKQNQTEENNAKDERNWTGGIPIFGIFVMGVVLIGALVASTVAPSDQESPALYLTARSSDATTIDTGKTGPSKGDLRVFDSSLLDDSKKKVGQVVGIQTTIDVSKDRELTQTSITYDMNNGSIAVVGTSEYPIGGDELVQDQKFTRIIVGGTGEYSDVVGGEVETVLNENGEYQHQLFLIRE